MNDYSKSTNTSSNVGIFVEPAIRAVPASVLGSIGLVLDSVQSVLLKGHYMTEMYSVGLAAIV